ncbi:flagellar basal body P-ring formation chaperone FlgA [Pseudomonas sp. 5P_3.1_Bac2]|uniref:flagellar basal body P-ring formation chaperone FlgA n=1 Tax=Pseudomonas sp. 5P_3.1_Bac2 TaxID=2971617 RepID=UPI0021C5F767|nr:flagellar basal body P-ring formation chaperone FlgA [Pseudomonas sp. 5P_3.1_Bac2]MCU1715789.1 flagellar basal body P-ring formation chaperone FlgA [Pseudomonas sp. 5P_3.1_Bac2]
MKTEMTTYCRRVAECLHCLAVIAIWIFLDLNNLARAETTRPADLIGAGETFLEQAVTEFLQRSDIDGRHEVQINRLDPRLRLPLCPQPLTTTLENPKEPLGRVTLRVRCEGDAPWTVFVPGQVKLYRQVVIAARPLKRDSLLTEQDIVMAERDVGLLNQGYLSAAEQAVGKKLTRPLQPNQVLGPIHVQLAEAIRKGDHVVISARSGTINVRMPGEALSDGVPGKQISVRNLRSGRVIRAQVTGPGQVEVAM